MSTEGMSPERTRAFYKFKEAEQQVAKRHYEQALMLARDALDVDPTYIEVRHWIVDLLIRTDESRKASLELQDILHSNRDDQHAWDKLREVDAAAAERLERLHDIAPDPFVVMRTQENAISDDLDDLGGLAGEFVEEQEELITSHESPGLDDLGDLEGTDAVQSLLQDDVGAVPLGAAGSGGTALDDLDDIGAVSTDMFGGEEEEEAGEVPAAEPQPAPVAAAGKQPSGPVLIQPDWMYEEDLKYRAKLDHNPVYARLLPNIVEFWSNDDEWDTAISGSAHLDEHRHPEIVAACREAEAKLGAPKWTLYFCPERRMICTITRGNPPTISLTTGLMNTLSYAEQVFAIGRFTTMLMVGHVAYLQMTMLTLERTPRGITDVETDMLELLKHHHGGWDAGVHRDDRIKLGALCHAWQQRAELTADRGGLICCGDLEVACSAIARTVAPDTTAAETANWRSLRAKYEGQDAGKLAAIAPKEDPMRNEAYGVYRIQMLRWWAKTPAGQAYLNS